jgi:hypothetical protein
MALVTSSTARRMFSPSRGGVSTTITPFIAGLNEHSVVSAARDVMDAVGDLLGDIALLEPLRVEQHAHRASRDRQIVSPGRIWRAGRAKLVGIMDGSARGAR